MPAPAQQPRQVADALKVIRDLRDCALLASISADPVEKARQEGKCEAYEQMLHLLGPRQ